MRLGPRWVRGASAIAGPRRAQAVTAGESDRRSQAIHRVNLGRRSSIGQGSNPSVLAAGPWWAETWSSRSGASSVIPLAPVGDRSRCARDGSRLGHRVGRKLSALVGPVLLPRPGRLIEAYRSAERRRLSPHPIGSERFVTVSSGTLLAQVAGAILGNRVGCRSLIRTSRFSSASVSSKVQRPQLSRGRQKQGC